MQSYDYLLKICHRMIYIYHITLEEEIDQLMPIKTNELPTDPLTLRNTVDKAVNNIKFTNLPESLKQIWQEDKFNYMTWIRDELINLQIKDLIH